ncbi:MAG TPA: toll/interleukin-1 receptor domain-containing protein [Polyangiaceae bacterium]|nr:toll/interleukin-1 receptor domain-containing protein [Polyangiaceae bacterium]
MSSRYATEDVKRIAEALQRLGSRSEAVELLCARVLVAPDKQQAKRLLAIALHFDPQSRLATTVFEWLEGLRDDSGPIAELRGLYDDHVLAQIEAALPPEVRPLAFRVKLQVGERTFEVVTEASGPDYRVITTTLATGEPAHIVRAHRRVSQDDPLTDDSRRRSMKAQQAEMVRLLRTGQLDSALAAGESEQPVVFLDKAAEEEEEEHQPPPLGRREQPRLSPGGGPGHVPRGTPGAAFLGMPQWGAPALSPPPAPAPASAAPAYPAPVPAPTPAPPAYPAAAFAAPSSDAGGYVAAPTQPPAREKKLDIIGWSQSSTPSHPLVASVFCAPSVAAGDSLFVQVFAHPPEQEDLVRQQASEFDGAAKRRGCKALGLDVPLGTELTVHLSFSRHIDIDEPVQSLRWLGNAAALGFEVRIPTQADYQQLIGTVAVSADSIPLGNVKFKISVHHEGAKRSPTRLGESAVRYRRAFISYCSEDREAVLARVQMLRLAQIEFFQDLMSLEPGQDWARALQTLIDDADLFLLFWSNAARRSKWVEREIAHALARQGGDALAPPEIVPVLLEGPPFPPPPAALSHLHFGDKLRYFAAH